MKIKTNDIIAELFIVVFALVAILATCMSTNAEMNRTSFYYYTIQSNIWIGISSLAFAIVKMMSHKGKNIRIPNWFYVLKYISVVGITLTMIVFWTLLAPAMGNLAYLFSMSNLFAHTLTPIMAIISFLFFDCRQHKLSVKTSFLSITTPFYYLVFALILSSTGFLFYQARMPYFFVDFYEFGWFGFSTYSQGYGFSSFGVFYWLLIVLAITYSIGILFIISNYLIYKYAKKCR